MNLNDSPDNLKMKAFQSELAGLKKVLEYLWDGNQEAFNALIFIRGNYKRWDEIFKWLKDNQLRGQALADMFKNESTESGGGYHLGVTLILSRIDGLKKSTRMIKVDELR